MQLDYDVFERLCAGVGKAPTTVAEEAGVARTQPGKWRRGEVGASRASVAKIANYFGVSVDSLLQDCGDTTNTFRDANNSTVIQGSNGVTVNKGQDPVPDELSDQEKEVLRIFRSLDMRAKNKAMSYLFELEDGMAGKEC